MSGWSSRATMRPCLGSPPRTAPPLWPPRSRERVPSLAARASAPARGASHSLQAAARRAPVIGALVSRVLEWNGRRLRFPAQGAGDAAATEEILTSFALGSRLALHPVDYREFCKRAARIPWHLRAFAHEGHALGVAARLALRLDRSNPVLGFPVAEYTFPRFLGFGFWNGACTRYPAPTLGPNAPCWVGVPDFAKYRPLLHNGYGFSSVLLRGRFDGRARARLLEVESAEEQEAALHGAGRALWFLYMNNCPVLRHVLDETGAIQPALGVGLGFAIGFTLARIPGEIARVLASFPPHQGNYLRAGVGIALQVHACNDPEARDAVERLAEGDLSECYRTACEAARAAGDGA